jgi:phthiodiolone/phenolphthiodiolone dimycocerosates ketoreductase
MLRAAGRYADGYFPGFPHSPQEYARRLEVVRTAASDAGRDPMAITPAMWILVVTGRNRSEVDEALDSEVIRAGGLLASDEFYAERGAQHPLGVGFSGAQDILPQDMDEQTALSHVKAVPKAVVRDMVLNGTPDEVVEQAAVWRDHGVRYLVLMNMSLTQRNLRTGLASIPAFTKIVHRLKKL